MDWLGKDLWLTWIGIAVALAIIEVMSLDLVFLMFAIAALVAGGLTWALTFELWAGMAAFGAVATVLLLLVRPRFTAKLHAGPTLPSGQHGLVGQLAIVEEPVSDLSGRVEIEGLSWTARPARDHEKFAVGDRLVVTAIEGATARVARKDA